MVVTSGSLCLLIRVFHKSFDSADKNIIDQVPWVARILTIDVVSSKLRYTGRKVVCPRLSRHGSAWWSRSRSRFHSYGVQAHPRMWPS